MLVFSGGMANKRVINACLRNRHLPFGALRVLTDSKMYRSDNYTTPPDILDELAHDASWSIRLGVARNPSTALDTLLGLARDPEYTVSRLAKDNVFDTHGIILVGTIG